MHALPSLLTYELCQARQADIERRLRRPARVARRARRRSVRQSTGWLLVDLGLRLAAPRPRLTTAR